MVVNPLQGLVEGLLQGHQLGMQLRDQQMQEQAFKTRQALDEQNASIQDIMNRQTLERTGREITNGTIQGPETDNPFPSLSPAMPVPAKIPGVVRKADPKRTVTYQDRQGNKRQYELKTPEEQDQAVSDAARQKFMATAIKMKDEDGNVIWMAPEHAAAYRNATAQWQPIATGEAAQAAGAPAMVPQKNVGQVINNTGRDIRNDATIAGHEEVVNTQQSGANTRAAGVQAGANSRAAGVQTGANTRSAAQIAGRAANTATTQAGANGRSAAQIAAGLTKSGAITTRQQQKELQALQAREDDVQAARIQINTDLTGPDAIKKAAAPGRLKTTAYQLQSFQTRKASIVGATAPPKAIQDKLQEGQQATAPDGHIWQKKDGIVYFVK